MRKIHVGELCKLLRKLGVSNKGIAAHLQVTSASLGAWTGGKLPIPHRHFAALRTLVRTTMSQAIAHAEARPEPPHASLLTPTPALHLKDVLLTYLRHWELELSATTGLLERTYAMYMDVFRRYGTISPLKLGPKEREALRIAGNGVARTMRTVTHLGEHEDTNGGMGAGWPDDKTPLDYFDRLCTWVTTAPDDSEEDTDED